MSRAALKLAAAAAVSFGAAAALLLLTQRARTEGRLTHCRNNLRQIGVLSFGVMAENWDQVVAEPSRGRALLQLIRRGKFYDETNGRWIRGVRLNPFGCPVKGVQPPDLTEIPDADYQKLMSDVATIDYLAAGDLPAERPKGKCVFAADRAGNHPSGGYVLLVDFSVEKIDQAVEVTEGWEKAAALKD